MVQTSLNARRLFGLLGRELSEEELSEALFRSKVEFHGRRGDELDIEVTPDRLDLLDEGGLAWTLQGILGLAEDLPYSGPQAAPEGAVGHANPSVNPLRPALALAVVEAPEGQAVETDLLEEVVRYQEILHASLGRDRRVASLGLYRWTEIRPPVRYALEPIDQVRFQPLGTTQEIGAREFYATHPMARTYGELGRQGDLVLTLRDARDCVLSLPPVLNAVPLGEVRPGDRHILIESTGTRAPRVREAVGLMLLPFVSRGWSVRGLPVHREGHIEDPGPSISCRAFPVSARLVQDILGIKLSGPDLEKALRRARLHPDREGSQCIVQVPPWRPDILSSVDLVEEVAISHGYSQITARPAPGGSRGSRLPSSKYYRRLGEAAIGLGYQEVRTPMLLSAEAAERFGLPSEILRLQNPISREASTVRSTLRASLVAALAGMTGQPYPQKIFEIGYVATPDPRTESGTRCETHLALVEAGSGAGFARSCAVMEQILRIVGIVTTREPTESPGTLEGRLARFRFAGETLALAGEVHPSVLEDLGLLEPVSFAELSLSLVWTLREGPGPA
jgi:phenylalanyl-tRNA synthetase beta chain